MISLAIPYGWSSTSNRVELRTRVVHACISNLTLNIKSFTLNLELKGQLSTLCTCHTCTTAEAFLPSRMQCVVLRSVCIIAISAARPPSTTQSASSQKFWKTFDGTPVVLLRQRRARKRKHKAPPTVTPDKPYGPVRRQAAERAASTSASKVERG